MKKYDPKGFYNTYLKKILINIPELQPEVSICQKDNTLP